MDLASRINPELRIDPSALPILTDDTQSLLLRFLKVCLDETLKRDVSLYLIEISGFSDPEENTSEIVVTHWVDMPPDQALEYWNEIGLTPEKWRGALSKHLQKLALKHIAFEVRWDLNAIPIDS